MIKELSLRPVEISGNGKKIKGYFHRFVYMLSGYHSETKALIELEDGKLRYFDPYFVQFVDRDKNELESVSKK
ncbi:MAG: hypothetical protein ABJG41_14585 [Cyclobacteriaceae bacterium]